VATSVVAADAIIVAAGSSRRMGGADKLAAVLAGRPVLAWAVDAVAAAPEIRRIALVVAEGHEGESRSWLPQKVVAVVGGGGRRQASVAAGFRALAALPGAAPIVLVHDGARPLVPVALVSAVARAAHDHGAALPVVPVAETVRRIRDGRVAETVDRTDLVAAQTPQGVRAALLAEAYERFDPDSDPEFTDEAALLEACRIAVHPIPGDPVNLKVTLPADLARADALLRAGGRARVGFGTDLHPFGPGDGLRLGGIEIAGAPRLHGHSDGDVALHAIADALLGAVGLGDLGRQFPADARTPRGADSGELLRAVVARLAAAGWRPVAVDVTIVGARPRLAAHLDGMRARIAELVGLHPDAVSAKASTGNLDGSEGAGRTISAAAVATVIPGPGAPA
jgi:2-C-methyl-D-erythritol 4-phosphate cytidylyltransferase/2-C-methyl-D-erythritol 2,4-cyclodiphosphate synthase